MNKKFTGGIRKDIEPLKKESGTWRDWYCKKCGKREYTYYKTADEDGVYIEKNANGSYDIPPNMCCAEKMVNWGEYTRKTAKGIFHIKDIEPYMTVAADKRTGKRIYIGSRREHEEFLKRNDYIELGNEPLKPPKKNEKIITADDIGYAAANCKEILASDEYKEYTYKANKE